MVSRNQMFPDIDAHAQFFRRADYHANFSGVDAVEQFLPLFFSLRVVHESNLIGGNAALNQTLLDSRINRSLVGGRCLVVEVVFAVAASQRALIFAPA